MSDALRNDIIVIGQDAGSIIKFGTAEGNQNASNNKHVTTQNQINAGQFGLAASSEFADPSCDIFEAFNYGCFSGILSDD